ncbi:hypothetical protein KHC23_08315 [Ancylobacter dichloromethanicus]|uniref:Bulb-type lectin domain-containing protein n=1 Tax=Ancylobacter dichloromethanicus TaxID=518825 RepID=A0A9W6N012_9HYPH|nr:hypothetical protein [Ancylobacter dichloromethanicus]MBS7553652.1 hypothetical protein [Ancylobacter dichloromethanicus]GLK72716.1 hypothetical protein GCM10017643_28320 [Ancylobacter dichloromethanicus]
MSDETVTPKWVLTRVTQVDGRNMSLGYRGESTPRLEITTDGKTLLNTSLKVAGRLMADELAGASGGPVAVTAGLSVHGGVAADGGLTVTGSAAATGTIEAAGGLVGMGAVPVGAILMWSGDPARLPAGWFLCNGAGWLANGDPIPDLRGSFIVGHDPASSDYKAIHNRGGDRERALAVANLPKDDVLTLRQVTVSEGVFGTDHAVLSRSSGGEVKLGSNGTAKPFDIRPPWYALAYIVYGGPGARASAEPDMRSALRNGEFLSRGQSVASPSGRYAFMLETGGRLVLLDRQDMASPRRLWVAQRNGADAIGARAIQQADSNFVLYTDHNAVAFASDTFKGGATLLRVTDAGTVTIDRADGTSIWSKP